MKKRISVLLAIMIIVINIFSFLHINENIIDKILYDKTMISFNLDAKDSSESMLNFLKKIEEFSEENNIEIAQYNFLSSNKVDIYSTKKNAYDEVIYVPNVLFDREIRIHDFEDLLNVGFKNLLYIDTNDTEIIQKFSDELKNECEIDYSLPDNIDNKCFSYIDINSLSVISICVFLFILVLIFYYSRNKNEFLICQLWGRTHIQTYCMLNTFLVKIVISPLILIGVVTLAIIFILGSSNPLLSVFYEMVKLNIVVIFTLILLSFIIFLLFSIVINKNRKKVIPKIIVISNIFRFFLLFLIIVCANNFFVRKEELEQNLNNLATWNETENLYNLQEIYSSFNYSSLVAEDTLNDKILKVYQELSDLDKVFIINTLNFQYSKISANNQPDYNYLQDIKKEEDLYSPYGINIVVDRNYLRRHEIKSVSQENVVDALDNNDNVLNLLVPQKYKKFEENIKDSFKEWFYFQKVEVTNIYREANNQKKIDLKIDDLNVNIIYVRNKQHYFTYNQYSGDSMNTIEDPIITVYTENIDNSYLGSCLGKAMFIESKDEYTALKEISTITEKYNAQELNSISSVYDQKGDEIQDLKDKLHQLLLNIIIILLFLIMFMIVISYSYYKLFFQEIVIKSLYGYTFNRIYKSLILTNLFVNLAIILFWIIIYKEISFYIIIIIGLLALIDYFILRILNMNLFLRGEIHFIKGDFR